MNPQVRFTRLVYLSRAARPFEENELEVLERKAAARNQDLGVTGYLSHYRSSFIQFLEGDDLKLRSLMASIGADPRHDIKRNLILGQSFGERLVPDWSMRYVRQNEFVEIQLEDVLEQVMTMMKSPQFREEKIRQLVTRLTEKLAISNS